MVSGDGSRYPDPGLTTNLNSMITTLGGNHIAVHLRWDDMEPNRPQGGDPVVGSWSVRDYTSEDELGIGGQLDTLLTYFDGIGIDVAINLSGTNLASDPDWLYDSTLWTSASDSGGHTLTHYGIAPLPADRATYGGDYPMATSTIDAASASWQRGSGTVTRSSDGLTWGGDYDKRNLYFSDMILNALLPICCKHPCVSSFKFYNEPKPGDLTSSANFGSAPEVVNQMWRCQSVLFDQVRAVEPERAICFMGISGHNSMISTDASIFWTHNHKGNGPAKAPADHPTIMEWHMYFGGTSQPVAPDVLTNDQGGVVDPTTYAPFRTGSDASYVNQSVDMIYAAAKRRGIPPYWGETGIGNTVTNASDYYVDLRKALDRNHMDFACFTLASGAGQYATTVRSGPVLTATYTLNAQNGPRLQDLFAKSVRGHHVYKASKRLRVTR